MEEAKMDANSPMDDDHIDDLVPAALIIAEAEQLSADEMAQREKLMDSLSFSFPGGSLASALAKVKADDDMLSQSCFSQIRLDKGPNDFDDDDDLTSLEWLQDTNLLKNIGGSTRLCPSPLDTEDDITDDEYESGKENDSLNGSFNDAPVPHPSHIPYNPQKHVNSKPPYSFSCLIFMAIEDSPDKKLPVKDIYSWILSHFPYFQNAPTGWKNSVRHNLSLNKCFQKVDKDKTSNIGKGSYWCIDPDYRPNLLQALRKTPYHPFHQLQMMSTTPLSCYPSAQKFPFANRLGGVVNAISPHLFPFLSKRLNNAYSQPADINLLDSDIDVANALVSLKKAPVSSSVRQSRSKGPGQRSRSPSPPEFGSAEDRRRQKRNTAANVVITEVPSADHTYSASSIPSDCSFSPDSSSIDGEYEFHNEDDEYFGADDDDELITGDEYDSEEEEEMQMEVDGVNGKEVDGINALLNLASIATSVMSEVTKNDETTSSDRTAAALL